MFRIQLSAIIIAFIFVVYPNKLVYSASRPLGVVVKVRDNHVVIEFDPSVYLKPGGMVAIYGGGSIRKHPLTDEVVVEELEQVAKAQIKGKGGNLLKAKLTWIKTDFDVQPGMDVVPLPAESAPNSPPIQIMEIDEISMPIQSAERITVPIEDPDGDAVYYVWELKGENGRIGFLESRITRIPENTWFAPGIETNAEVLVTATDSYGQKLNLGVNLSTSPWENDWRERTLKPFCTFGGKTGADSALLSRDERGQWWSVTSDSVFTISPGWLRFQPFLKISKRQVSKPKAMAPIKGLIHLLDLESSVVKVFTYDGAFRRSYGIYSQPTDMVISKEGVVFIADQGLGGVQVYEPSGLFRACLGRGGQGTDYFSGLARMTLDREGQLYALDRNTGVIHRFGRFQHRLPGWRLNSNDKEKAVDLSWHPKGELLILLNDGRILRMDKEGKEITPFLKSVAALDYIDRVEPPQSLYVDQSGEIFVAFPNDQVMVRYTEDGNLYGLRGSLFGELTMFAADCKGQFYGYHADSKTIFKFDSEGWMVDQIGTDEEVKIQTPSQLAVTPDGNALAILDSDNTNITLVDLIGTQAPIVFGQSGRNEGQFLNPVDMVMDELGRVYILDSRQKQSISVFDQNGYFLFGFGRRGKSNEGLRKPALLAVTPDGTNAYVYDGNGIKKYAIDHQKKTVTHIGNASGRGRSPGQVLKPERMACDRQGLLYIVDSGRKDLQVIDYREGNALTVYANNFSRWGFQRITEAALNVDGKLYLVDSGRFVGLTWEK